MRKYIKYVIIAFLGGLIASGAFWLIMDSNSKTEIRQVSHKDSVPVYQTSNTYNPAKEIVGPDMGAAAKKSVHAVVHIKTDYERKTSTYEKFFGFRRRSPNEPVQARGSGVIISEDGYIVTNNHVVESADKIKVTLNDKRTFDAEVVGLDANTDLGLIKIDAENLPTLEMGNSDRLSVGEWVLAVGNPFNLTSTVTAGIVSAKARNINILGRRSSIESFIQTDAAVNRGNSGGALVNTEGKLVGINAAIASNTGSYTGYSFAIPINIVRKVVKDLKEFGFVQRGYIGVTIRSLNSKLANKKGIDKIKGVYINDVKEDGAADKAGLKKGDVIISVNGKPVNSSGRLLALIALHRPGDKVRLGIRRDKERKSVEVILRNKNNETNLITKEERSVTSMLGAKLEKLSSDKMEKFGLESGVQVKELNQGKFKSAGIREGFIIVSIDREKVESVGEIKEILNNKTGGVLLEGIYPNGMRAYYGFGL